MSEAIKKKVTRALGPHIPPDWEIADAVAVQALVDGVAEPHQQKRALQWIVDRAAGTYEFNYYPGDRDTCFALGRAFVGQQIVKLMRINVSAMTRVNNG